MGATAPELIKRHEALVERMKETHPDRVCRGEIDGVLVVTEPFYTDRRHERARVLIGLEQDEIACEWTTIPWNIFKEICVSYWVWIDQTSEQKAAKVLRDLGIQDGHTEPDPYAEPARYHVWVKSLEDVVKLWRWAKQNGWVNIPQEPPPAQP